MSETQQPKQFSIAGYTPGGYQVNISFTMSEIPSSWDWFDNRMSALGLSPRPIHKVIKRETLSHVARRDHYNKNGATTPHIAFYSASQHLELRFIHVYMDTKAEREAFEAATGITIASIPAYDADSHPKRDGSPRSQRYLLELPRPITIEYTEETFTDSDGSEGTRKHFVRYITPPQTPKPNQTPEQPSPLPDASVGARHVAPELDEHSSSDNESADNTQQSDEVKPPPTDRTLSDKISDFRELGRKIPQSNHDASVGARHVAPENQSVRNSWNTPISPFAPPTQAQGTTRKRDDKRNKITQLRVHGRDLAIGDCVRLSQVGYDQPRIPTIGTIKFIGGVDPTRKIRKATVEIDGQHTQEMQFDTDKHTYYTVVGGSKIDTAQADPTTYDMLATEGATWRSTYEPSAATSA